MGEKSDTFIRTEDNDERPSGQCGSLHARRESFWLAQMPDSFLLSSHAGLATTTAAAAATRADGKSRNEGRGRNCQAMTVKELWKEYQFLTGNLTEHARKLGFAGVAVCWMFKDGNYNFPVLIYLALLGFVTFFLLDILHYKLAAKNLLHFTEQQEAKLKELNQGIETTIDKPRDVDKPAQRLNHAKYNALIAGFFAVGLELIWKLIAPHVNWFR